MCEVLDRVEARGIEKGIAKGREEGIKEGIREGIKEGIKEGTVNVLISLVKDGILSIADAAKRANMSEESFIQYIKWYLTKNQKIMGKVPVIIYVFRWTASKPTYIYFLQK